MHCIIVLSMIPFSYEHKTNVIQSVLVKENFKQHLIVFSNIEPCGVWSSFVLWWEEEREVEVNAKPENGGGRLLSDQIVGHQRNAPDWGDVKTTWFSPLVLTSRIVATDWKSWKSEPIPGLADSTTVKMAQAQNDVNWRRSSLLQFNCCIIWISFWHRQIDLKSAQTILASLQTSL